jgi:hypothetical protein
MARIFFHIIRCLIVFEIHIEMNLTHGTRKLVISPSRSSRAVANPDCLVQQIKGGIPIIAGSMRIFLPAYQSQRVLTPVSVKDLIWLRFSSIIAQYARSASGV